MKIMFHIALLCGLTVVPAIAVETVAAIPGSELAAPWRNYWAANRARCMADIEANRKSDVSLVMKDAGGRILKDAACDIRQISSDFVFGCNGLCLGQLGPTNAAYEAKLSEFFNLVTTAFCADTLEPEKGRYRFAADSEEIWRRPPPDRVLNFARAHGMRMKGQTLVYDRWHPKWAKGQTKNEVEAYYRDWIRRVAERYGGSVWCFDVVNKAFDVLLQNPGFPLYRRDEAISFVDWAFAEAGKVFPKECMLGINMGTASIVWDGDGHRYFDLCRRICDKGFRLDAIGFQFNLFNRESATNLLRLEYLHPDMLRRSYDEFAKLKRPLFITEITMPSTLLPGEAGRNLQAEIAEDLYRFWFSLPQISGVTWWNLCDGATWVGEDDVKGALLDEKMGEKPVYKRLRKLITQDWRTRLSAQTDSNGRLSFRGFRGTYEADFGGGTVVRFDVR